MANDQFFSFDEALDELRLQEEELKRLVSEGEIRAFREGETMKLRRADVEALRSELSGGEVVDLGDVTDDLVFEDDPGMITEDLTETGADTLLDDDDVEDVGEIDLDEEDFDDEEILSAAPGPTRTPRRCSGRRRRGRGNVGPRLDDRHHGGPDPDHSDLLRGQLGRAERYRRERRGYLRDIPQVAPLNEWGAGLAPGLHSARFRSLHLACG